MDQPTKQHLLELDRRHVWHPFTQMKDYAERDHVLIERAEGIFLYDADGNRYYDTNSSWWVNLHGHAHPRLKRAIAEQLERMDHVMFSGLTHPAGIELAARLVELSPPGLNRVFYSDNGSTAVEVALKMSYQYWRQSGKPEKTRFVYLENSYHGDTLGAVSVGGVEQFHSLFRPLLFDAYRVPAPNVWAWPDSSPAGKAECVRRALDAARQRLETSADEIAGFIVEPMIQAAGGMIIYPADYLRGLRELCTQYGVHLIADEVATGFGRTGTMFACEHAGIAPDLLCLAKGVTAGLMPLSATLCAEEIYAAFYDDYAAMKTFFHGHSFTGNPLAAAIGVESLRIFDEERVLERVADAAAHLSAELRRLEELAHVGCVRGLGMVAAFDLLADREARVPFDFRERMGYRCYLEGLREGLMLRPLGDTLYYWLPLCATPEQIGDIVRRTERVLRRLGLAGSL